MYEDQNAPLGLAEQGCNQEDNQVDFILHHSYEDFPSTEEREESQVIYWKQIFKGSEMEAVTKIDQASETN